MILALAVHWLIDDDKPDAVRPLLAAILWIGLGTLAFGLERGYGMALGLMGGVTTLLILGNVRALLSLGPLAGLVMYRAFREVHVDATRALDIGQHYALIGMALGALTPMMPVEWLRARISLTGLRMPLASMLWIILLGFIPAIVGLILGPKGVVGFVAGLGFASLLASVQGRSLADEGETAAGQSMMHSLGLGIGLAAATTLAFQFLGDNTMLSRDEKVSLLVPLTICIIVLSLLLALVSPKIGGAAVNLGLRLRKAGADAQ